MRISVLLIIFVWGNFSSIGQSPVLNWSAYGELYAGYDDLRSKSHNRPDFLYNHTRNEELAVNVALVRLDYSDSLWRAKGGLIVGNYVERNLASELPGLRNLFESTIGVRLQEKHDLWLEAGIFPSHIGYETVIGSDNPNLTRSLIAENSPYYESGVKITGANVSKKWTYSVALLNGWQRISRVGGYYPPSLGCQVKFDPNAKWSFNYSNYIGDESPDDDVAIRHFHDVYVRYRTQNNLLVVASIDAGNQPDLSSEDWTSSIWYGGSLMISIPIHSRWYVNARAEQFVDDNEIVASNPYDNTYHLKGYSVGFDYQINNHSLLRIEGKRYEGPGFSFLQHEDELTNVMHMGNVALTFLIP